MNRNALRCRRKFLRFSPGGFRDETYIDRERSCKWETHQRRSPRHGMIFSFEKMALRDAVKTPAGARAFAEGLYELLHGSPSLERRLERWVEVVAALPRRPAASISAIARGRRARPTRACSSSPPRCGGISAT